jgi:reductive dehalogenase
MNKFHSTISRRDFMKALGLAGAGLGAAAATTPVFHDLDEVLSAPESNWDRPWWVKGRAHGDVTQEMDWNVYNNFDIANYGTTAATIDMYGQDEYNRLRQNRSNLEAQHLLNKTPGYSFRDRGLYDSVTREGISSGFKGYRSVKNPAAYGNRADPPVNIPRYQGTPEENIKMLRTVAKLRGAAVAGALEIDDKVKKTFFKNQGNRLTRWADVDDAEETKTERITPNKAKYILTLTVPMSEEMIRRMPTALAEGAVMMGYSYGRILNSGLSNYLWMLGYLGLGAGDNSWKIHPAQAVLSGCGEASRMHQNYVSPELGASQRAFSIVTDLPLAPTPPIDFGMQAYCKTCKKCADVCPGEALDRVEAEPSWESPYFPYNQPGQKAWPFSFAKCRAWWYEVSSGCGICMSSCPFSSKHMGSIHDVTMALIATTPIFNGFMKNMDDFFGYGLYPGGYITDQDRMNYINPTQQMRDFYDEWWDLPPKLNGIYYSHV